MRNLIQSAILIIAILLCGDVKAHDIRLTALPATTWNLVDGTTLQGYFLCVKDGQLVFDDAAQQRVVTLPPALFRADDLAKIQQKAVPHLEVRTDVRKGAVERSIWLDRWQLGLFLSLGVFCLGMLIWMQRTRTIRLIQYPPIILIIIGLSGMSMSLKRPFTAMLQNDPLVMNEAFSPFVPNVNTLWDDTYFYVESHGIPNTHDMMVGISNHGWQQQVPIPQCYIGNNAWPIPLNPVMSDNPIPVDEIHFTRGAIAVAVNGVPIFNYHTNTGVDSYLDGQLDNYGGHCGRADDYHYHIAPLHLYAYTNASLPIAYGLDGFPVFGELEPDGSAMQVLDDNHGHWYNGEYHYHGTSAAPYMIGRMAGVVTEDSTHQLIPQAAAHPVRPGLTPLNGALITACTPNSTANGYNVTYTLQGQTDSVVYSWTANGIYTFQFFTAGDGTAVTETHNGFTPCSVPIGIQELSATLDYVYPNPTNQYLTLPYRHRNHVQVDIFNSEGKLIYSTFHVQGQLDVSMLNPGMYILRAGNGTQSQTCQFIKQ